MGAALSVAVAGIALVCVAARQVTLTERMKAKDAAVRDAVTPAAAGWAPE